MKKCDAHANGKPCISVIAEGRCLGKKCELFGKVVKILPKLKKMYELKAQGVILTTIWDFSEEEQKKRQREAEKAEKWLKAYHKIEENLKVLLSF